MCTTISFASGHVGGYEPNAGLFEPGQLVLNPPRTIPWLERLRAIGIPSPWLWLGDALMNDV
jgi:hypothetical protein